MATQIIGARARQSAERRFYSRMAFFMAAVVLIGFGPSFYARGYVHWPRPSPTLPPSVMLHGILFSVWMLVFVAQTQLVAAGRRDLHIRLGGMAMLLAIAIVPLMYLVTVGQVPRANQPAFTDPLNWTIVPLAIIPPYVFMLWTGWSRRRDAQWHKRAMLGAALMLLDPAIGRLPLGPPILPVFALLNMITLATFVPLIRWDLRSLGRAHPATILGLSLLALALAVRLVFLATGAWAPVAEYLPGIADWSLFSQA